MRRDLLHEHPTVRWRQPRSAFFHVVSRVEAGQEAFGGAAFALLVGVCGWILSLQGWRSRPPAFDMLTYYNNAAALLHHGVLPRFGDVSSYGSFSPPGTSWFMALGMSVFFDPRLYEKAGSCLLYVGTLLGIFLLARAAFGRRCAYLSVLVYGLSGLGLSIAGSLWPIGHPFFYVWMGYFTIQWVKRHNGSYLAVALFIWVVGMNVDMTIAPAVLAVPVVWLFYRPPLLSRTLLVATILGMAVWFPYLQFEAGRHFTDLKSQMLRESVIPANYKASWCNPGLTLLSATDPTPQLGASAAPPQGSAAAPLGLEQRLTQRIRVVRDGLVTNYSGAIPSSLAPVTLLVLTLATLAVVALETSAGYVEGFVARHGPQANWIVTARNWVQARSSSVAHQRKERLRSAAVLLLILAIPWLFLLAVAEPGRPERFYWLWPVQVIALTALCTNIVPRSRAPRIVAWAGCLGVAVMLLWSPVFQHANPILHGNWAGADPNTVRAVDFVASDLRSQGEKQASIGYQVYVYQFMPADNVIDPQYKVGADLDLLLRFQHDITNTDTCAEGVSSGDEYRIVQTRPDADAAAPREFVDVSLGNDYHLIGQAGAYQVFKRN